MREKILAAIRQHVAAEYPNEACGVIIETGKQQRYIPCKNIADKPTDYFTLCPLDYAAAETLGEVIMVVHSHPDVVQLIPRNSTASSATIPAWSGGSCPGRMVTFAQSRRGANARWLAGAGCWVMPTVGRSSWIITASITASS